MSLSMRIFVAAAVTTLLCSSRANADTFSVPLQWSVKTGDHGEYLSSSFDFQKQFSDIQSVSIQFAMPDGYLGIAVAGGYFSASSDLWIVLHRKNSQPTFGYFIDPTPTEGNLATNLFNVPAGAPQNISLFAPVISFGDEPTDYPWPDFISAGNGEVAITDYLSSTSGFQPTGPVSSTQTWRLPGEVTMGSLTIVGTVVPEPAAITILIQGAVIAGLSAVYRALRGNRLAARC